MCPSEPERDWVTLRWNFIWAALSGALFQFGTAFADIGTVIAVFVGRLTPSALAVGAAESIARYGWLLPQLFAANYAQGRRYRKPIYLAGGYGRAIYPDHLTVGMVTFEAAFVCAPGPLFYSEQLQEGLSLHKPEQLYFIMSQRPDTFVDISQVWAQKMNAVHLYKSQGRDLPEVEPFFQGIAQKLGAQAGLDLAEGFRWLEPS